MDFSIPIKDITYSIRYCTDFKRLQNALDGELSDQLFSQILDELNKFTTSCIAPLNQVSDKQGAELVDNSVVTSPGFREAYETYMSNGWGSLAFPTTCSGQGLPDISAAVVGEALSACALSFSTVTTLTTGAAKAIEAVGTAEQQSIFLGKLVSGEWTATMNLTESQAGSDLSLIKTRAERVENGLYKIKGQKIYITYGDHDLTNNIVHLVLARLPDAPPGTRGISMFLVPKWHTSDMPSPGQRNDVNCIGLEEKMGIHGSPTATMAFGESGACFGTLLGEENKGLRNMFIMMNSARLDVGIQGVGVSERAYQRALNYAQSREQGSSYQVNEKALICIFEHPDVRRMLYTMKVLTEASRAICYGAIVAGDLARQAETEEERNFFMNQYHLLTPVAKAWSTDRANEIASLGVQIHGGLGYIEEAGAAQHMRDARILSIYEGTNGIQAIDLVNRKLLSDQGKAFRLFLEQITELTEQCKANVNARVAEIAELLEESADSLKQCSDWLLCSNACTEQEKLSAATHYLKQFGNVAGGYFLTKGILNFSKDKSISESEKEITWSSKLTLLEFYSHTYLTEAIGLTKTILSKASRPDQIHPAYLSG